MSTPLPARPNLSYLKKLAKERLVALRAQHPEARLAEAQLALAREHGFASWRRLKAYVDAMNDAGAALLAAVRAGDIAKAASILDHHPELVNATDDRQTRILPTDTEAMALLHVAVAEDNAAMVRMLLDRGADPNIRNADGRLPLHDCYELGREEILDLLVERGAQVDVCLAAALGMYDRLEEMLGEHAELANDLSSGLSPLGWTGYSDHPRSTRILLAHGAICDRAPFDQKALDPTAHVANVAVLRILLEHGANPRWCDPDGDTLLHLAIQSRIVLDPTEYCRVALDAGADANAFNRAGRTPLDEALAAQAVPFEEYVTREPLGPKRLEGLFNLLRERGARRGVDLTTETS